MVNGYSLAHETLMFLPSKFVLFLSRFKSILSFSFTKVIHVIVILLHECLLARMISATPCREANHSASILETYLSSILGTIRGKYFVFSIVVNLESTIKPYGPLVVIIFVKSNTLFKNSFLTKQQVNTLDNICC